MTNLEQARIVVEAFQPLIHQTTLWVRSGERDAALDLMKQITTQNIILQSLGYMLTDNGNLVVWRPLVGIEKRKTFLAMKAAEGDMKAASELLNLMSK